MARLNERGSNLLTLHSVRNAADVGAAQGLIADALPPLFASALAPEQLELIRQKLCKLPAAPARPGVTKVDGLGAIAVFVLVFLSTFPVVIPFMLSGDAKFALRLSNAIAIAMLFMPGSSSGKLFLRNHQP